MMRTLASIILAALMIASIVAPAAIAAQNQYNVEGVMVTPSEATSTPTVKAVPYSEATAEVLKKIDKAILDQDYVEQLADRFSKLVGSVHTTLEGTPANAKRLGLIVKLSDLNALSDVEAVAAEYKGKVVKVFPEIKAVVLSFPADPKLVQKVSYRLAGLDGVEHVELEKILSPQMWDTTILLNVKTIHDILGYNGSGVLVAVLDTGVDPSHPAIPDPVYWRDFISNISTPYDDHGHGTHVAGTILGHGPSIFNTTTGMWHSVLVGQTGQFNYVDLANLTYMVNVTGVAGGNVTLELEHLYNLYNELTYYYYNLTYVFAANAYILYKFDNSNWSVLANFSLKNQTTPVVDKFNITVPANATTLYVSFIYDYLLNFVSNGTWTWIYISHWTINGWFINYVKVYQADNATNVLLYDDVATLTPPPNVINATFWVRTSSNFTGMAPGASLAAGKVCGAFGCPTSAILAGMEWAYNISADVVSMSLGGPAYYYDILAQMADWLSDNGITVVIAAGNSGPDYFTVESPGISKKAITVAAATKAWTVAYFSSAGPSPVGYYPKPDVAAPGMAVSSSVPPALATFPDFPYEAWAGTSMATPHVSGLVALIKQAHPDWTPAMIKSAIVSTADWLYPNVYFTYPYDIYRQGGGMIDPLQAIQTQVLPEEPIIFLGRPYIVTTDYIEYNITLVNLGSTNITANVTHLDAFVIVHPENAFPNNEIYNVTNIIVSPALGDTIVIPANGSVNILLNITLENKTLPRGAYGGHVEFTLSTGDVIKVLFGFFLRIPVAVNGTVYDVDTMAPIANATVVAFSPFLNETYNVTTSNATGQYQIIVPSDTDVRLAAAATGYYDYYGYAFNTGSNGTTWDIYMTPEVAAPSVLIVVDPYASDNVTASVEAFKQASTALGLPYRTWYGALQGIPADPLVLRGASEFPVVVYLAGGWFLPIADALELYSYLYYANYSAGLIVLSGGDIGWFHENDIFMTNVAHAAFVDDLWPGDYNITALKSSLTATAFGTDVLAEYMWAPEGTPIAVFNITYLSGYWPDLVVPVNGGYSTANWTDMPNYSAVVLYDGTGAQAAKTIYFAFDFETIGDPNLRLELAKRAILFYLDSAAPVLSTNASTIVVNGNLLEINVTGQFTDDVMTKYTYYEIHDENATVVAKGAFVGPYSVLNLADLGLTPNADYKIYVYGVDCAGRPSTTPIEAAFKYLPSATGGSIAFFANTTVYVDNVLNGAYVEANIVAPTSVQVVQLPSLPAGLSEPLSVQGKYKMYLDIYSPNAATNANYIEITIKLPVKKVVLDPEKLVAVYWDGTMWKRFTNATLDPETGVVTLYIDATTSPSLSELGGTPIILALPGKIVGGQLALPADTSSLTPLLLVAVGLVLLAARRLYKA